MKKILFCLGLLSPFVSFSQLSLGAYAEGTHRGELIAGTEISGYYRTGLTIKPFEVRMDEFKTQLLFGKIGAAFCHEFGDSYSPKAEKWRIGFELDLCAAGVTNIRERERNYYYSPQVGLSGYLSYDILKNDVNRLGIKIGAEVVTDIRNMTDLAVNARAGLFYYIITGAPMPLECYPL